MIFVFLVHFGPLDLGDFIVSFNGIPVLDNGISDGLVKYIHDYIEKGF